MVTSGIALCVGHLGFIVGVVYCCKHCCACLSVYICLCECVCEREREGGACVCVSVCLSVSMFVCVGIQVLMCAYSDALAYNLSCY